MKSVRLWMTLFVLGALAMGGAYTLAQSLSGEAEVRINARRLDDGRTEFALQQRTDGEWGERILPDSRYFPSSPRDGRWLHSSPLTIETTQTATDNGGTSAEALAEAEAEAATAQEALGKAEARLAELEAPIYRDEGISRYDGDRITAEVEKINYSRTETKPLHSVLRVRQDGQIALGTTPLMLQISCFDSSINTQILNIAFPPTVTEYEQGEQEEYEISYRFTPAPEQGPAGENEVRRSGGEIWDMPGLHSVHPTVADGYWYTSLRQAESVEVLIEGADGEQVSATFSMDGVWDTPITPNLDRCGTYYFD